MKTNRVDRAMLVGTVAASLPRRYWKDVPAIRQAINDTADSYRKGGWICKDFEQDAMVLSVQVRMQRKP